MNFFLWNLYHPAISDPVTPSLFVAIAIEGGKPKKIKVGIVIKLPAPTKVSKNPPINPIMNIKIKLMLIISRTRPPKAESIF